MKNMSKKKLMVIGPQFFSYTDAITAEIIKRGFFCSVFNQLHSDNIFTKPSVACMTFAFAFAVKGNLPTL